MNMRITRMDGDFAAVAAWTGQSEEQVRADAEEYDREGRDTWLAWDGVGVVGVLVPWRVPDGRLRLYFDRCRDDAYAPLADAVTGACFATLDRTDAGALGALRESEFVDSRSENVYEIPVARHDVAIPEGIRIISADRSELQPLMMLDCALRADIPGSEGWQPDPVWFREETYDSPNFDPRSYRVALDGDAYVGLCRIWRGDPEPRRLGMIGVLAPYRRRGLGRALIAAAMAPIVGEVESVTAEADATNAASHALLTSFGARITGGSVELFRPA